MTEHPFALLLTHDVDRPYKTIQAPYNAVTERDPRQLLDLLPGRRPYWQFDRVMAIERELGVRSAFYFLRERSLFEQPLRSWLSLSTWRLYAGRYELSDPAIAGVVADLDAGGWEVGVHGSYTSYTDPERLAFEVDSIESLVGHPISGGRQHYLNLDVPATWAAQRAVGLRYDATLGSSSEYGFQHGYRPLFPFDDSFAVFPTTLMELTLPDPGAAYDAARRECEALLAEAAANDAVMTVLWHPSYFSRDYPGYARLYRWLIERALGMGAWVGPPDSYYEREIAGDRAPAAAPGD